MANSRYEYVKWFEVEDEVRYPNIIVVQIDGRDFGCFSEKHGFEKPNDDKALNLMNACAIKFCFEEGNHILPETSKQNTIHYCVFLLIYICNQMERVLFSKRVKCASIIPFTSYQLCINGGSSGISSMETDRMSYKQSIQYLFVEAGVFWKVRKGGERDSEGAVINSSWRVKN
uniref:tRNAHis guanylyltransferase catalytic domain-containing protein n=1 Tax=Solanum tuberosum TaxID=4113 RepID=M0ZZQ9_SOLTU